MIRADRRLLAEQAGAGVIEHRRLRGQQRRPILQRQPDAEQRIFRPAQRHLAVSRHRKRAGDPVLPDELLHRGGKGRAQRLGLDVRLEGQVLHVQRRVQRLHRLLVLTHLLVAAAEHVVAAVVTRVLLGRVAE